MLQQAVAQQARPHFFKTEETLMEVTILQEWTDDHLPCIRASISKDDVDITTRIFTLMWAGPEIVSALRYADESPRAFEVVKQLIDDVFKYDDLDKQDENSYCGSYGFLTVTES